MRSRYPAHRMDIPIPFEVYQQLLGASCRTEYEKEDWEIAAEAIEEWMRRHHPDSLSMPATRGYQWKRLFLPNGTLLRTVFSGTNHHCMVENDAILYDGRAVSPCGFVDAVGGIRRNAWKCIWILFPDTKDWKLADSLRAERPRRARKPSSAARRDSASQEATACAPITIPPSPVPPTKVAPVSITPVSITPVSVRSATITSAVPSADTGQRVSADAHALQHALREHVQAVDAAGAGRRRQPRANARPAPPASDRITALLRQELFPLLHRLCALDEPRPEFPASREALIGVP